LLGPQIQSNPHANGRPCRPLSQKLQNLVKGSAVSQKPPELQAPHTCGRL
jgi:hypothetical protein